MNEWNPFSSVIPKVKYLDRGPELHSKDILHCQYFLFFYFIKNSFEEQSSSTVSQSQHEFLFSAGFSDDAADGKAASSLSDIPEFLLLRMIQEQTMNIAHI